MVFNYSKNKLVRFVGLDQRKSSKNQGFFPQKIEDMKLKLPICKISKQSWIHKFNVRVTFNFKTYQINSYKC